MRRSNVAKGWVMGASLAAFIVACDISSSTLLEGDGPGPKVYTGPVPSVSTTTHDAGEETPSDAGPTTSDGASPVVCTNGKTACGASCVDPLTDTANCGTCGNACAAPQVCNVGTCALSTMRKRAFVTSAIYYGNLGGLTGADAKCQTHANAAALGGVYKAWLSDSTGSPSTRFTRPATGWQLVDGRIVATSWDDLIDGSLTTAIMVTETGGAPPAQGMFCATVAVDGGIVYPPLAWSNTSATGTQLSATGSCADWTGPSTAGASWGRIDSKTFQWTNSCGGGSNSCTVSTLRSPLYCFEQ